MNSKQTIFLLVILIIIAIVITLTIGFWRSPIDQESPTAPEVPDGVVCALDAKMCPDGSYVGRIAPKCEFAMCPKVSPSPASTSTSSGIIKMKIGDRKEALGVAISEIKVVSDSRCPASVQCIWAGTVVVKATTSYIASAEEEYTLGKPVSIGNNRSVTLTLVTPSTQPNVQIPAPNYEFTFEVKEI